MTNFYVKIIFILTVVFHPINHLFSQNSDSILSPIIEKDLFVGSGFPSIPIISPAPFTYRIPALNITNKGTLLAVCDRRNPFYTDLPNDIDIVMKRSFDNGQTWTDEKNLVNTGRIGNGDCQIIVDRVLDKIFIFFINKGGAASGGDVIYIESDDDGENWSSPIDITENVMDTTFFAMWPGPGNGIQTRNGRLIAPYSLTSLPLSNPNKIFNTTFIYSDDHGSTWNRSKTNIGRAIEEPTVVQLNSDSLLFNCRSRRGVQVRATVKTDLDGNNWTEISDQLDLLDPIVQGSAIRYTSTKDNYKSDRLLFSNPSHPKERKNLTVQLSYDEGQSYPIKKALDPNGSAYSSMVILPNGDIGIFYEKDYVSHSALALEFPDRLTYATFTLEDLTNNKDSLKQCTPPIPIQLSAEISDNKVTFTWNEFYGGTQTLEYKQISDSIWSSVENTSQGFQLENLPFGEYTSRIKWYCKENRSYESEPETFEILKPTSIKNTTLEKFRIYPNPTNDFITITLDNPFEQPKIIEIVNALGITVLIEPFTNSKVNLSKLSAGLYQVILHYEDFMVAKTVVVK
jgi:hypothetical protein